MLENISTPGKAVLFFITRLFILLGMVLFFSLVAYIAGFFSCQLLFGFDFLNHPELFAEYEHNHYVVNALKLLNVVGTIGGMLLAAWIFPRALQQDSATFLQISPRIKPLFWVSAFLMILVSIPLITWLVEINSHFSLPESMSSLEARLKASEDSANALTKAFLAGTSAGDLIINLIVVALVPAITEEFLFRGALQRFIKFCFGNTHAAVLSAAIIFSAIHGQIYGFMPRMVLGMLLGYIFAYSGSIWPAILVHFLNNAISVCIHHFNLEQSGYELFSESYHFPLYAVILSALTCVLLVYWMFRNQQPKPFEYGA